MQSIKTVKGKFVPGLSKSILKMDFYPVLYFLSISINLMHILGSITSQISSFNSLFKWFDPSNYIDDKILVFLFVVPLIILAVLIILIIFAFKHNQKNEQQEKILQHYVIKITATIAFILSSVCCLPLIRCSISLIAISAITQRIAAITNIILFLTIIYPYSMFFLTDLSPQNNKIYACIMFPNCFTYLNIYRPIAAIMIGTNTQNYLPIPSTFILLALLIGLIRFPLLTWRFNRISQMLMSTIIWTILFNFIDLILSQEVTLVLYFVGIPIFTLFMDWLLSKRTISIIMQNESSTFKLKILYYMLINKKDYENELSIFILNHHRNCMTINCYCQSIFNYINVFKKVREDNNNTNIRNKPQQIVQKSNINFKCNQKLETNSDQNKKNQIMNQQKQQKQNTLWFKLLFQHYNNQINFEILNKLSLTEKKSIFNQKKQLLLDKVELLTILDLQYQSLRQFWSFQEMQNGQSLFSLFLFMRMFTQKYRQSKLLKKKAQQHQTRNCLYNYKLQKKIIKFRQIIYKATTKAINFWAQLDKTKIDNKILTKALQQLLSIRKQMIKQKRKVLKQTKKQSKAQKQDIKIIFQKQIQKEFSMIMTPFQEATRFNFKQIKQLKVQIIQQRKIQQNSYFEKNLPFTSLSQHTGIAVINIKQGSNFGQIKMANKYFWQFLNCQRYQSPYINHFLPPQIREYHSKRMVSFLQQNKQSLYLKQVYLVDPQNNLIQLQLFVQILPSIQNGFQILTFIKAFKSVDSLFLLNNDAEIVAYNKNFKQKILSNINVKELRQLITDDKIRMFRDSPQRQIMTQDQKYQIKCIHYMTNQHILQPLYYCHISPAKQQKIQQKQQLTIEVSYLNPNQNQIQTQNQKHQQQKQPTNLQKNKSLQQQQIQLLESVKNKVKYLSIEKKYAITYRWKILTTILFVFIIILSILASFLIEEKIQAYSVGFKIYDNLTNFIQNIAQCTYMTRKINVLSFNRQTGQQNIQYYYDQLKINQYKLVEQIDSINLKWWNASFQVYDLTPDGKVISSSTTFQMIIKKYIIAALTTYLEKSNWNYDYILSQQIIPYSDSLISLMSILRNSYYIILPKASVQFRQVIHKIQYQILAVNIPFAPVISVLLIIAGIIVFVTILVRIKIVKANQHKFKIFQNLDTGFVNQRLQTLQIYQVNFLEDLKITKHSQKDLKIQQKNAKINKKRLNIGHVNLNQLSQIDVGESSVRGIVQNSKILDSQILKIKIQQGRTKHNLHIPYLAIDKKRIFFKSIIGVIPILFISSVVLCIQVNFNKQFWSCLTLKDLYHQKIQMIKFINTYSYQMGYEISEFKSQNYSINSQIETIYKNLYALLVKIEQYQRNQSSSYLNTIKIITSTYFCELLQLISTENQATERCNAQDKQVYKKRYAQQVLVQYIQKSRHLKIKYQNLRLTSSQQRQFNNQTMVKTIERLNKHLKTVHKYQIQLFNKQLSNQINQFKILTTTISLLIIPFAVIAIIFWVKYNLQQMQLQIDKIKMVMQLISMREIQSNQKLRNYLLRQKNMFSILD